MEAQRKFDQSLKEKLQGRQAVKEERKSCPLTGMKARHVVEKQSHGGEEDSGVRKPRVLGQTWCQGKLAYERERSRGEVTLFLNDSEKWADLGSFMASGYSLVRCCRRDGILGRKVQSPMKGLIIPPISLAFQGWFLGLGD